MEESEHITLDRSDSVTVRPLKGLGGQVLSTSTSEAKMPRQTTDLTRSPRPSQITRTGTASPDRARMRQRDNEQVSRTITARHNEKPAWEHIQLVLHLELPTQSGKPHTSQGITFVRAVDSQPNCKKSQSQANPRIEVDGKVPSVSGLIDATDQIILPLTLFYDRFTL